MVWWPKLHEIVTSFVHLSTTCEQTKDSTAVPPGLLQTLLVPESHLSSWSINFTTNLSLFYRGNTVPTYVDHLKKYKKLIPYKMGDKTIIVSEIAQLFVTYIVGYFEVPLIILSNIDPSLVV